MSLSFQGPENDNEHLSNGVDTRGEKKEKEVKYPKELNPFEDSSSADEPSKQAPGQDTTVAEDSRKIPVAVPCSEEKVKKKKRRNAPPPPRPPRPSTEYPKELNPFGDSSNEDELCEDPRTIPAEPVPCSEETEGQSNEATSLSIQGPESNNEKPSNNAHTPSPSSRRGKKKKKKPLPKYLIQALLVSRTSVTTYGKTKGKTQLLFVKKCCAVLVLFLAFLLQISNC